MEKRKLPDTCKENKGVVLQYGVLQGGPEQQIDRWVLQNSSLFLGK